MTILDTRDLEVDRSFESDVCIVGAGAAGITLAVGLAKAGLRVHLVEGGGLEPRPDAEGLHAGRNLAAPYPLRGSRLLYLGGSTNHWGGTCRPLEAFDFEPHRWIPHSGWPIDRAALAPYYDRARPIVDLPATHFEYDPSEWDGERDRALLPAGGAGEAPGFEPILWRSSPPTRFGEKYRETIARSERIVCVLHAHATELVPHRDGKAITHVETRSLSGRSCRFRARRFVLAAGGIENARLLLLSDSIVSGGIGNAHGHVGRYFSEHLLPIVGSVTFQSRPDRPFAEERFLLGAKDGLSPVGVLGFASRPALRSEHRLLGFSVMTYLVEARTDSAAQGVQELLSGAQPDEEPRSFRAIVLSALAEQAPDPENRVMLQRSRNALGMRDLAIQWRPREIDLRSVRESARLLAAAFARGGNGRMQLMNLDEVVQRQGGHHSGTTRMSDDPRRGVTDANGQVHGVANLYVAGSSLFPTAGYANPTLSIVALALRLENHLVSTRDA